MDKIENLHDLEYMSNIQLCLELSLKWSKLRPENKEVRALSRAIMDISFYVLRMSKDLQKYKEAISDYRHNKNKALIELKEIKDKYNNLQQAELNSKSDL